MASSTKKITGSSAVYDSGTYTKQTWTETSAAGANTYAIQQDATSVKLKLTGATGDIVRIGGLSAEYQVKFTNKTLTLTSDTQKIVIAMNSSAVATISFLDGSTTINSATRMLGTQKLKVKLADITTDMNADSAEALATADYFSDPTYTATVTATAVTEGQDASFVIKLDKPATSDVLLNYSTQSGTATSNDFAAATGSVVIRAGQTTATVNVTTNDDAAVEVAETFTLRVSGQQLTAPVDQTVTINDNDVEVVAETYDVTLDADTFVNEGNDAVVTIMLDRPAESNVVLNLNTFTGTANSRDFIAVDKTVTILKGQDSVKVAVATSDDFAVEDNENFTLVVNGEKLSGSAEQIITIVDDDIANVSTSLTMGQDSITGTAANDTLNGIIVNNANTFQSGDFINGGAGTDTLQVELGNSSAFAIRAITQNVEKFVATVQSTNGMGSSGTNNVDTTGQKATVDAEKMVGVKEYWNSDSRADLKVEDIRILDNEITKDITIGLRNTDPGSINPNNVLTGVADNKVDYEVYFSPESLRPESATSTSKLALSLSNQLRGSDGFNAALPLDNVPYTQLSFNVSGVKKTITFDLKEVDTYEQLETALNASIVKAIAADPSLTGLTLNRDGVENFTSKSGEPRQAPKFVLSLANNVLTSGAGGWEIVGQQPDINAFAAEIRPAGTSATNPLITSTIVLDNVGREDEAGTLTIGSMSTHGGVERFEVTVENNGDNAYPGTQSGSWLGHMQSTSNTLQEVKVVNAATGIANPDYLYLGTNMDQAGNNLTVMQDWPGSLDRIYNQITPMFSNGYKSTVSVDGDTQQNVSSLLNPNGLVDVRLFDASTMKGNVFVGASITADTIRKYQNLVDTQATDSTDDVAFEYKTGDASDSINLQIDGNVAASNSRIVTGRHDFSFLVDGGAGNDNIRVALVDGLNGNTQNWYDNQDVNNNVTVNGGAGNDTIRTPGAGDVKIDAGSGDDTIYTDNTGKQAIVTRNANGSNGAMETSNAIYVFNAADSNGGTVADGGYNVFDLRSQAIASVSAVNAQVTVNYLGIAKTVYIANSNNASANVAITDLHVNQAIKDAINNDPILNKLLIAQDGPGRTLLVSSLIDGQDFAGDLAVTFGSTALTATQAAIPGVTLFSATNTNYAALTDGYAVIFAQDNAGTAITGAFSTSTSDNLVLPGTGNDVVVLGMTTGATTAASSNETVVYDTAFGNDTIVAFDAAGAGIDHLDFTKLGGSIFTSDVKIGKSITVGTLAADATTIGNLFNAESNATATTHVYVAVNAHNIGSVYTITDPVGTGNSVATLQGTIDLAYTQWAFLTAANFVDSSAGNYYLNEGANTLNGGVIVAPPVVPGAATALAVGAGATTVAATAGVDVFSLNVAGAKASAPNTQNTITSFNVAQDSLSLSGTGIAPGAYTLATVPAGIAATLDPFAIPATQVVNFGLDANGDLITLSLVGVATAASVNVTIVS